MVEIKDLKSVLIIGAGTMGHSIAQVYAQTGFEVDLVDTHQKKLDHALELIKSNLGVLAEFNRVQNDKIPPIIERIHLKTELKEAADEKMFVVEAVSEIPELKKQLFDQLSEFCPENAILASNTSTLDIFKITKGAKNRQRIIAHHWFAPPHIIPLVEVVPSSKTSPETVEFSVNLLKKIGKKPIVIDKFLPGYIVNRIQMALNGAMYELLARNIATPEQIDLAIKTTLGIRLPIVGIAQSQDFTGLDLVSVIMKSKGGVLPIIQEKIDSNELGAKTGKGLYDYHGKSEGEVLKKRDRLFLRQLEFLEKLTSFKRV
ncbi:MAG: 3-hydroxyacyl-CoA dehydrogenase family protein [Candidatus Lokiarchaeota archaeon]|nr:3-hydroxyacyl-CoA dehydrogenase family protein [Candidatus Lokiarchaeota archaeon]